MKLSSLVALALAGLLSVASAQEATVHGIDASPNNIVGSVSSTDSHPSPSALVTETDMIFPHVATGGGWETVMVIVNLGSSTIEFTQKFFDQQGRPMEVTLRTFPEMEIITTSATQGRLGPGSSFNFALFDSKPDLQVGWATLAYDSSAGRLGGYAAFRFKSSGVINEALVPLSSYEDTEFMMPFDNIEGFATGIALCNPASNLSNQIQIVALDLRGQQLASDTIVIPPSGQTSFVLADRMRSLAGKTGTLRVQSNLNRLSAVGIRMNVAGGLTFTSIPVMNWISGL